MADDHTLVAHLLRRTGFGPRPGTVEELAAGGVAAAVDAVLGAGPLDPGEPPLDDDAGGDDYDAPVRHWLALMCGPDAGLHEKLTWFWHGHLCSSYEKIGSWSMMWRQHLLLREHALGNFRALLQAVTVDPAMLVYLDGDGSLADAPNENHSRELMELFALGRGSYTQRDVAAGAIALSGWYVEERASANFDPASGPPGPVTYLGRDVADATAVVDAVCDHPACPRHIVTELHRFLTGVEPEPARRDELSAVFAESGLEIRPLVEAIVRHPSFLESRHNRPRYPVEWVAAAIGAFGFEDDTLAEHDIDVGRLAYETCSALTQNPYYPPSVAGWPEGPRWLAPMFAAGRAGLVRYASAAAPLPETGDPVTAALGRCSLYEVTPRTRAALDRAASALARADDPAAASATLLALAVCSPEFALA